VQATEALRITSSELVSFGVMDTIIEEPLGGAHSDPMGAFPAIKKALMDVYNNKCATALSPRYA
jgi:acetyl-CoA carboxylase carboxyl transferase subunit alpha